MDSKLPISVIVPTRNCRSELERHLLAIREVACSVREVVCVDGESTDGTSDVARKFCEEQPGSRHFLKWPAGLYEGWNAAVKETSGEWIYFSTVGDVITVEGLRSLLEAGEQNAVDVVISPPQMLGTEKMTSHRKKWPIHDFAQKLPQGSSKKLSRQETILGMCSFLPGTLLGSSASNLYRGEFLKKNAFPVEYGHAGDTAWGVQNCLEVGIALVADSVATFELGWDFKESDARQQRDAYWRLVELGREVLGGISKDAELGYLAGWFDALSENKLGLWDWLASQAYLAQQHHGAIQKIGELSEELERRLPERIYRALKGILSGSSMEGGKA